MVKWQWKIHNGPVKPLKTGIRLDRKKIKVHQFNAYRNITVLYAHFATLHCGVVAFICSIKCNWAVKFVNLVQLRK